MAAQSLLTLNTFIVGGPLYQESGRKNRSTDNLVIGMDNNLRTRPFTGLIDEVAIHAGHLWPDRILQSLERHYQPRGFVKSVPFVLGTGGKWRTFRAETTTPARTKIVLSLEDDSGNMLLENVKDEADLSGFEAKALVLRADLSTSDPGQTPILHSWPVSADSQPSVQCRAYAESTAALARPGGGAKGEVAL